MVATFKWFNWEHWYMCTYTYHTHTHCSLVPRSPCLGFAACSTKSGMQATKAECGGRLTSHHVPACSAIPSAPPGSSGSPPSQSLQPGGHPLLGVSSASDPPPPGAAGPCGAPLPQPACAHWLQDCPEAAGAERGEGERKAEGEKGREGSKGEFIHAAPGDYFQYNYVAL